jgi:hypothetical protein
MDPLSATTSTTLVRELAAEGDHPETLPTWSTPR